MPKNNVEIRIQENDFCHGEEYRQLVENQLTTGAAVTFTGLVRDMNLDNQVTGLFLEHYPGMTEKSLLQIVDDANQRWELIKVTIVHRVGQLSLGDQIVFVGVTSKHRKSAFAACEFLMDFLKTKATFWKKEMSGDKNYWIAARESDCKAAQKWDSSHLKAGDSIKKQ